MPDDDDIQINEHSVDGKYKPDSVKVALSAAGKITYEIKIYFDSEKETPQQVINKIVLISEKIEESYPKQIASFKK